MESIPGIPQNFQGYIQQATKLVKEAKTAIKIVKDLDVATVESELTGVFTSALAPVFSLIGQFRSYIPTSIPNPIGSGGIGGIGNLLNIPNCNLGNLNNNVINTLGAKNL
jgi:xanthine/uracil/vitamin C permease (AzgA family)